MLTSHLHPLRADRRTAPKLACSARPYYDIRQAEPQRAVDSAARARKDALRISHRLLRLPRREGGRARVEGSRGATLRLKARSSADASGCHIRLKWPCLDRYDELGPGFNMSAACAGHRWSTAASRRREGASSARQAPFSRGSLDSSGGALRSCVWRGVSPAAVLLVRVAVVIGR